MNSKIDNTQENRVIAISAYAKEKKIHLSSGTQSQLSKFKNGKDLQTI